MKSLPIWRRLRVYWAVKGPQVGFLALVVSLQIAFGTWQLVKYITDPRYTDAFGWGVALAKTCAGALYPTLFFLILSMSRYLSTFLRRSYYISRFINWDVSQSFHVKISIVTIALATLHAIGHLTGSFVYGSQEGRQDSVAALLGPDAVPRPYVAYIASRPGWTGITALALFYLLALMSMPKVRKWNYEVFQLGHLLMFPIIALLMTHGTLALLQFPMLGYWLAFPTLCVLLERTFRFLQGLHRISAQLDILDEETVCITALIPHYRVWPYKAGQYVFLQVPQISFFQWHPFTISTCTGNKMQVHIKADGDWTKTLHSLGKQGTSLDIKVGIDGPFGAPAQRFYDFDEAIVVGAGIGVTPFSGILTDLQQREQERISHMNSEEQDSQLESTHRRIDFHWLVRDRSYLLWFSDLLNKVSSSSSSPSPPSRSPSANTPISHSPSHSPSRSPLSTRIEKHDPQSQNSALKINIVTHVTAKRKAISTHIFRWLLEQHRTPSHPYSPLTGLINTTHFGRPDLGSIMTAHYEDMCQVVAAKRSRRRGKRSKGSDSEVTKEDEKKEQEAEETEREEDEEEDELKVGVFFCGPPVIGFQLADWCWRLTARGREEGSRVEYYFMIEVFG